MVITKTVRLIPRLDIVSRIQTDVPWGANPSNYPVYTFYLVLKNTEGESFECCLGTKPWWSQDDGFDKEHLYVKICSLLVGRVREYGLKDLIGCKIYNEKGKEIKNKKFTELLKIVEKENK